jgi:hypothetical protein
VAFALAARLRLIEHRRNGSGQCGRIAGGHQERAGAGEIRDPAHPAGYDWSACPHRLLHYQRPRFPSARHHDHIRRGQQRRQVGTLAE